MSVVIVTTPGATTANSYATAAEADAYFAARLPLVPPWEDADDPTAALAMSTRVIENFAQSLRVLVPDTSNVAAYYKITRHWTGLPASATQRLSWPRVGMFDANGNALDWTITAATIASPTVITTNAAHRLTTGDTVFITGSDTTPSIDGTRVVTVISTTTFSISVAVTVAGTTGSVSIVPQALKDAESEFAGQLLKGDRTLDNDVLLQGLTSVKAGSVALTFKDQFFKQTMPDAVLALFVPSWLTDETVEPALPALFDVVSAASEPWPSSTRWW